MTVQGKSWTLILYLLYFSLAILLNKQNPTIYGYRSNSHHTKHIPGHESVIMDMVPLFPIPGQRVGSARGHCCSAPLPQCYPSLYRKLSHCLRKEAGSRGHEAAGSQPRVQSSEPQPGLVLLRYRPAVAASCLPRVCRPQNTCLFRIHSLGVRKCTLVF